jgi:phage antirepressor YoqD-like protein
MVSQTERGEQARNYFIEIEKRFVSGMLLPDFTNPAAAARAWADQVEARMQAETKLLEAKPALEFVSRYVEAEQKKGVREVAKVMNIKETEFVDFLLKNRIMFRQQNKLLPYAEHQQAGYFEVKTGEKNGYAYHQTRFTTKGIAWIANKLSKARGV